MAWCGVIGVVEVFDKAIFLEFIPFGVVRRVIERARCTSNKVF